jgi:hypothetical protein
MDTRALFVDQSANKLTELILQEAQSLRTARYLPEILDAAHGGSDRPADGLTGPAAAEYLSKLIEAVSKDLMSRANGYSAARWLWYLRRLPDAIFQGSYSTTIGYDRALAESLTWFSKRSEQSANLKSFGFRVDGSAAKHVLAFVMQVRLLSHLHSNYRRIGKGAELFFENGLPFSEQDDSVAEAIRIYDERHEQRRFDQAALGVVGSLAEVEAPRSTRESRVFRFVPCEAIHVPIDAPDLGGRIVPATVVARHMIEIIPVESFLRPYTSNPESGLPYLEDIEPLLLLQMMFPLLCADLPALLSTSLQVGYGVVSASRLERVVSSWLPPLREYLVELAPSINWSQDFQEWLARINAIEPSVWPLKRGGCIREALGAVVLDFTASSGALMGLSEISRSNFEVANIRAETFEIQVQGIIDGSKWKPDQEVADLRGRALKRAGADVTDIDAIGMFNGELLLVSCKSLVYDREYDKGTHRVVANAQTTVDKGVVDWLRFVRNLDTEPSGDNFDFSAFRGRIIGIVCTPYVVYSSYVETLAFARPGLRRCVAAHELRDWLDE